MKILNIACLFGGIMLGQQLVAQNVFINKPVDGFHQTQTDTINAGDTVRYYNNVNAIPPYTVTWDIGQNNAGLPPNTNMQTPYMGTLVTLISDASSPSIVTIPFIEHSHNSQTQQTVVDTLIRILVIRNTTTATIQTPANATSVKLFPNPSNDVFYLQQVPIGAVLMVQDLQGRTLSTTIATSESTTISLGNYAKGLYLLSISSEKGREIHKLIKE